MSSIIPLFKVFMADTDDFDVELLSVIKSGYITQGKQVEKFESMLKQFMKYDNILTVNSGTSALTLAFRLLNLQPGDEVLSTPLTCTATNFSILANNLTIKWVDVDSSNMNMDLDDLKYKITEKTKAICFVHWGGNIINYNKLEEVKAYALEKFKRDIPIIEDCAHAFGSPVNYNNICCFSLQAIKHLTTGDGGIITLPTKELYERAKLLRWFGISREQKEEKKDFRIEDDIAEFGYKYHMNDINATIGIHNLPHINNNLRKMRENANFYTKELNNVQSISLPIINNKQSAFWLYTILINKRDDFIQYMKDNNIQVSQVHKRNDNHSCLQLFKCPLPNLDNIIDNHYVSIPVGWWLTPNDRNNIVNLIKRWDIKYRLNIRLVNSEDFKFIKILQKSLNGYDIKYDKNEFINKISSPIFGKLYVAELDNKIVGMAKILIEQKLTDSLAHIEDVVVKEDMRNMGICGLLLQYLQSLPEIVKCYKIILNCKDENVHMYMKYGYTIKNNQLTKIL